MSKAQMSGVRGKNPQVLNISKGPRSIVAISSGESLRVAQNQQVNGPLRVKSEAALRALRIVRSFITDWPVKTWAHHDASHQLQARRG